MANEKRILIAEDDENDRFLIQRAFDKAGAALSITFVWDGEQTIEVLKQASFPLLLLDLKMPLIDGFQVLEWFTQHPQYRPLRVVVLTSSSDPKDMERATRLGADSYLVKPHDPSEYVSLAQNLALQNSDATFKPNTNTHPSARPPLQSIPG